MKPDHSKCRHDLYECTLADAVAEKVTRDLVTMTGDIVGWGQRLGSSVGPAAYANEMLNRQELDREWFAVHLAFSIAHYAAAMSLYQELESRKN